MNVNQERESVTALMGNLVLNLIREMGSSVN